MFDQFNRRINYLRISVTDRCNLRCTYCMPEEGIVQIPHSQILTFEEIVEITTIAVQHGFEKVRITGGEPLVRKGIVDLIRMLNAIEGITDLGLTTNGTLLKQFAQPLYDAGLKRINVSLDTLNPQKYKAITRVGVLSDVLDGLAEAKRVGFNPIKLNCVVEKNSNEPDARDVKAFAQANGYFPRFIPKMNLDEGIFGVVEGGEGGNCSTCNRLRLTADGILKPCLFSDIGYNVRELGIAKAIEMAIKNKPACGIVNRTNEFYNIGG
ncbi:MAG TPA: radical SAM protein [Bacteroidales bacterium]|nr:radical SAM protein [Bacteroidales bacterium]